MLARTVLIALALVPALVCAEDKPPKREPDRSAADTARIVRSLEPRFKQILKDLKVPGAAIAVVKDDQVVYLNGIGYRNVEKRLPFTVDTICQIASCSKAFCSATAAIAASEGLLSFDESPKRLLPEFRLKDPDADQRCTIADLMNHSIGLPRTDTAWWSARVDAQEAMRLLGEGQATYPFRYIGQYSNMGVETAGLAVAAAYKKSWGEVVAEKIAKPLGMGSTWLRTLPERDPERTAVGYYVDPAGKVKPELISIWPALGAAGGLQSTARDMATWVRFHLNAGEVDGKRLLPAEVLRETHRGRFEYHGGTLAGLGWLVNRKRGMDEVSHGGYMPGFETYVKFVPERRLGLAVLTNNSGRGGPYPIANLIIVRLIGKQDLREEKRAEKLAGLYFSARGAFRLRIVNDEKQLLASFDGGRYERLVPQGQDRWVNLDQRDPRTVAVFSPDPALRGKQRVSVERNGARLEFRARSDYEAPISPKELLAKMAEATGASAAKAGKVLECRYRARYLSEGIDAEGLMYRAGTGLFGLFERDEAFGRPILWSQSGWSASGVVSVDDTWREEPVSGLSGRIVSRFVGYCNASAGLKPFKSVKLVGEQPIDGEMCYVVQYELSPSGTVIEHVSQERFLPLRREIGTVWVERMLDYRTIDGIAAPMRLEFRDRNLAVTVLTVASARAIDRAPHWAFYPSAWDKRRLPRFEPR